MGSLTTRLRIAEWDEQQVAQFDDGSRITRATVTLSEGVDGLAAGRFESVMYYRADGTSSYVNVMHVSATLDGRSGTFALTGLGSFDGTTASGCSTIVADSATGGLAGISGTICSSSTHADYPFMPLVLEYTLP